MGNRSNRSLNATTPVVARDITAGYSFAVNTIKYAKTLRVQLRAHDRAWQRHYHQPPYLAPRTLLLLNRRAGGSGRLVRIGPDH